MAIRTKGKTEALRGNERIQQLMEEFPEIPRSLVVKADTIREGIRPSAATHQLGRWALPDAHDYFEFDKEDTHTSEETAEGYVRSPIGGYLRDGVNFRFMFDTRSPYEVRYEERGRYRLYRDDDPVEEVFFTPRPQWYDRKTSSGKPMPSVITLRAEAGWLYLTALNYCEYAKDNRLCKYCNINASEPVKKGLGLERITAKREQDIYETMLAACQEGTIDRANMSGGVMLDRGKEADNYAHMASTLKRAMKDAGREFPIQVNLQATEVENQMKMKEAGVSRLTSNLEVWDPRLFEIICPGKAKYVGRQTWLERVQQGLEVFGPGGVNSSFVVGVELMHPDGFKTEDEAAASLLEGWEWMMAHGIDSGGVLFRSAPGTMFAGMPAPRTEYFLRMSLAHYKLAVKSNKAPKPGGRPPAYSHANIHGDLLSMGLLAVPAAGASPVGTSPNVC